MKLIGLAGRMGVGKDTVAAMLRPHGYERLAFADALRDEVAEAIHTGDYPAPECLTAEALEAFGMAKVAEVYSKPTTPRMRALLQQWGTEYRRSQREDYWVSIMREKLATVEAAVISDVRFPDEADLVHELGGEVWWIVRPGCTGNGHISESVAFVPDRVLDNSGSFDHLRAQVERALKEGL